MNTSSLRQATPRSSSALPLLGEPRRRRWEDDIERAWRNASDDGPGLWKVGFLLSQGFLSTLLAARPWRVGSWADPD